MLVTRETLLEMSKTTLKDLPQAYRNLSKEDFLTLNKNLAMYVAQKFLAQETKLAFDAVGLEISYQVQEIILNSDEEKLKGLLAQFKEFEEEEYNKYLSKMEALQ